MVFVYVGMHIKYITQKLRAVLYSLLELKIYNAQELTFIYNIKIGFHLSLT